MQEKENIEDLFRDAFSNYEEPVKPELWSKVSEAINTPSAPLDPSQGINHVVTSASTGITGSITAYIAGAILVVASASGLYLLTNQSDEQAQSEQPIVVSEQVVPSDKLNEINNTFENNSNDAPGKQIEEISQIEKTIITQNTTQQAEDNNSNQVSDSEPFKNKNSVALNEQQHNNGTADSQKNASSEEIKNSLATSQSTPNVNATVEQPVQTETNSVNDINPNLLFEPHPASGIAPLTVKFETKYDLDKVEWNFGDGSFSRESGSLEHTFETPGTYQVVLKHFTADGQMINKQVSIEVKSNLEIPFIPNIFSPNGDGSNDTFTFDDSHLADYEVTLFDQSGKKVHSWKKVNQGWDGRLNSGKEAKEGTYFYVIFATGEDGHHNTQSGILQLIR